MFARSDSLTTSRRECAERRPSRDDLVSLTEQSGLDKKTVLSALGQFVVGRLGDPVITYEIGAGRLSIPLSHDLPLHRAAYPQYSSNLARIAASVAAFSDDFVVIDVGANVGDSLA